MKSIYSKLFNQMKYFFILFVYYKKNIKFQYSMVFDYYYIEKYHKEISNIISNLLYVIFYILEVVHKTCLKSEFIILLFIYIL